VPVSQHATHLKLERGDLFIMLSACGGGLGDPLLRDPAKVVEDVGDGYITAEHAREIYGVVLDGEGKLDAAATQARRDEIRRQRIGGEPRSPLNPRKSMAVSVERENGSWTCASCSERLADASENWRDGAVLQERPIAERFGELDMFVLDRNESPRVMIREHYCPSCAASLGVDVATDDLEMLPAARALHEAEAVATPA
jgi:N-methylhydantoinase B